VSPSDSMTDGIVESGRVSAAGSLLGRERELKALLEGLADARSGRGGLILIGGEPGIGKTRLADETASLARGNGFTVLWGKCWEAGGAPAYWPWVQALRSHIRATDGSRLQEDIGPGAGDIVQILPEIEELFPDLAARASVDPETARFCLFDSTASFLRMVANRDPVLLVIEDLQAADTASLLLLRFLAGQVNDMPALLVCTYRDVELTPDHPLTTSITDLAREPNSRHVLLGGLLKPDVARLIEATAGVSPVPSLVSDLHRQTGGNPLFVTEAIRLLAVEGQFSTSQESSTRRFPIPDAVREVISRRLGHLTEGCRGVLTIASVLGQEIPIDALRRIADPEVVDLTEAVDEAVGAGLLVEVGGGFGRFRFSHDLLREALYEAIPPGRRARIHVAAAEALEQMHSVDLAPQFAVIAHHFFEGAQVGDAAKAGEYSKRAAEHAVVQLAYEDSVQLYRMALHATELQDGADPLLICELLLGLGDAQMRAGDAPAARETFVGAAATARRLGLPEQAARAALGYGGRFVWARAANDRRLIPLLEEAIGQVGDSNAELKALLLARLAGALRAELDPAPRDRLSREAVEIARRLGNPATLAYALDGRFAAIWAPDTGQERTEIADEIIKIAEEIGDVERALQGRHYRLAVLLEHGDVHKVGVELPANLRLAERLRQPAQLWYATSIAAALALLEGRFDEAERLIAEALDHGQRAEGMFSLGVWIAQTYILEIERARTEELEDLIRGSMDDYASWPLMRCILLHLYTELGRNAEARNLFEAIASHNFNDLLKDTDWSMGMSFLAEVVVRLGDTARAATLYSLLEPYADRNGFGHPFFCTGSMSRYLGLLAGLLGRFDEAERHFEYAISMNEHMGARPGVAHSRHELALLLLDWDRPGDRERAAELLFEAVAIARDLGLVALTKRIEALVGDERLPDQGEEAVGRRSVFRRAGEYWSIAFEGRSIRLRDVKGLRYLAALLAAPGRELHALDLVGSEGVTASAGYSGPGLKTHGWGDAGEILDLEAKEAYRQRLTDLREELAEAEEWNDSARAERVRADTEALTRALAEAVGLGGRDRRAASVAERARLNVSRAIRSAMARIADNHPELGRHLEATIRTGTFCSYIPDTRTPPTWQL
jgi:predicted ATPase